MEGPQTTAILEDWPIIGMVERQWHSYLVLVYYLVDVTGALQGNKIRAARRCL